MNEPNPYFQEVVDAHVDIERWLSGRAEHGLLPALLERFSPHFSMVAARGAALDRAGLDTLFRQGTANVRGCASRSTNCNRSAPGATAR